MNVIPNLGLTIKTAVVIDDDKAITEIFAEMLELQGLEIIEVGHNGKDAVEIFDKCKPDLMFLDVEMPKMNGIEALKRIRKKNPDAKVVIVTGNSSSNLETMLEGITPSGIIFKPFDFDMISKTIEEVSSSITMLTQKNTKK